MPDTVGERIRYARKERGETQKSLAQQLGVSQQHVALWEKGNLNPSSEQLVKLAHALQCTTDWLLGLVASSLQQIQESDLAPDEQRLIELYRRGALPPFVKKLILDAGRTSGEEEPHEQDVDETETS